MQPQHRLGASSPTPGALRTTLVWPVLLLAFAVALSACGSTSEADPTVSDAGDVDEASMPTILATTGIWADVVDNAVCDMAVVEAIMPAGADPHAFEPSLADRAAMDEASLIVANGLRLEERLIDTIEASEQAGTPVFHVTDHMDTIAYTTATHNDHSDDDHSDDDEHSDHDSSDDPHVWFDPQLVAQMLPNLAERLVADVGLDAAMVDDCVADYQQQLLALDGEILDLVADIPDERRKLVTSHDSLGYFADRYGFEVVGTVIPVPSGLAETNPAQLNELAQVIEATGTPAIFAETHRSTDDSDALASLLEDVRVVTLLTGTLAEPGTDGDTYLGLLKLNAERIADALG